MSTYQNNQLKPFNSGNCKTVTNYFKIDLGENKNFFKYMLNISPEIPDDSKMRLSIWQLGRKKIEEFLGAHIFSQTSLFAIKSVTEELEIKVSYQDIDYSMKISWVCSIEAESSEGAILLRRFFGNLVKKRQLINIKNNYYDPSKKIMMQQSGFEVWPGYSTTINCFGSSMLIGVNLMHRVLRTDTALDLLYKLKQKYSSNPQDFEQKLSDEFQGMNVLTRYNGDKSYVIEGVDLNKSTDYEFETTDKEEIKTTTTIEKYYKTKYGITIKDRKQPLLINKNKKTDQIIYLVPELCILTGLTEENKGNLNLMKEMAVITKGSASSRIKDIKNFMQGIINLKEYKLDSDKWGITLNSDPIQVDTIKLSSGRILLSKGKDGASRKSFDIETGNFDREIQQEMFSQPAISNWIIFVGSKDVAHAETCVSTFKMVMDTFNYNLSKPTTIEVNGYSTQDWIKTIEANINPSVQLVLCICPGQKGKAPMYSEVKYLLTSKYPVPSQIILTSTIAKGKNLRSIINKLLIQICAKVGGEPWAIDNLTFVQRPTMTCGIDTYSKTIKGKKKIIMAFTASFNKTFTKYISLAKVVDDGEDLTIPFRDCVLTATKAFQESNTIFPKHIIFIRDGVSFGQVNSVLETDIPAIKKALEEKNITLDLTMIIVNRKSKNKFFNKGNNEGDYSNPNPGTLINSGITKDNEKEFYLISQKSNQGMASPIHYQCIYDDSNSDMQDISSFMYKLCYLYYNWSGSIKVPAPVHYAKKLAFMIGDHLSVNGVNLPNEKLMTGLKSLFYI